MKDRKRIAAAALLALCAVSILAIITISRGDTGASVTEDTVTLEGSQAEIDFSHAETGMYGGAKPEDIEVNDGKIPISEITAVNAGISVQAVEFDGTPCSISAYNIDGHNYFMIRDLAQLLNGSAAQFSVTSNGDDYSILATTGEAYTPRGGEMSELSERVYGIEPSQWKLMVNGMEVPVSAYNIDGSNFYRIRDLGKALGFQVSYNAATDYISISSIQNAVVPESEAVPPSWFDDAAFCGDSISTWLANYTGDAGLGNATFLTSTSFGIVNALGPVTDSSVHPSYQGTKMKLEDAIKKCGASKVYLMFGINDIDYGIDTATAYYVELVNNILEASPDVQIYIESVTPMLSNSTRATEKLNNTTIKTFNDKMKECCQANGWNYLDINSIYADEHGGLRADACSDAATMGLHITYEATSDWVNYLRTHTR